MSAAALWELLVATLLFVLALVAITADGGWGESLVGLVSALAVAVMLLRVISGERLLERRFSSRTRSRRP